MNRRYALPFRATINKQRVYPRGKDLRIHRALLFGGVGGRCNVIPYKRRSKLTDFDATSRRGRAVVGPELRQMPVTLGAPPSTTLLRVDDIAKPKVS